VAGVLLTLLLSPSPREKTRECVFVEPRSALQEARKAESGDAA